MGLATWLGLSRERRALTAAAAVLQGPEAQGGPTPQSPGQPRRQVWHAPEIWQTELWDFFDSLGEFRQGITWKANMLSRIRLRAARVVPDQDEPEIVDGGVPDELVRELAGGIGGQSGVMTDFAVHLNVPGECYLIGETQPGGTVNKWYVRSTDEVRRSVINPDLFATYDPTATSTNGWRDLPNESLVTRVWRPHKRQHQVADSPARAARTLLRELELLNRHIQAQYLSRLASAGMVLFPEEVSIPVRPEFADLPDPFVAEWVQVASESISTPGAAASIVPIPVRVPGEWLDKIKHVDFTLKLDDQIIAKRNSALTRLAISLDMPPEALLGTKDVNHWNAWLIDEQGVKIHVAPDAEIICHALTVGYLRPRLIAAGLDPDEWVVWYDASELILRPDRSEAAREVYDRGEINGGALRRENGFDESDKPTDAELRRQLLIFQAKQPLNAFQSMSELGLETEHDPGMPLAPDTQRPAAESPPEQDLPEQRGPAQDRNGPPATLDKREALAPRLAHQASLMHAIRVEFDGWVVLHPAECDGLLKACPVTHAIWHGAPAAMPATRGTYRLWLNPSGLPVLGQQLFNGDTMAWLETPKHAGALSQPVA